MNLTFHFFDYGRRHWALLAVMMAMANMPVMAETITLSPDQDNTLYERDAGDLSNGAGSSLFFGQTGANANFVLRRALLRFDLSSIPPGSVIEQVELTINVDLVPQNATGFEATLHRVQNAWGEGSSVAPGPGGGGGAATAGDATWLHTFFDNQFWMTPGGDFMAQPSASTALNNAVGSFTFASSPGLIGDVQAWVNQPDQNFGWIILGEENTPENARRIGSRENSALAPILQIQFERAPELPEARPVPVFSN
ncbi:MAG: DNRLRE domain-containing protein, partial [Pseudomonadota bacterium]